jgi:hypothetical protein
MVCYRLILGWHDGEEHLLMIGDRGGRRVRVVEVQGPSAVAFGYKQEKAA